MQKEIKTETLALVQKFEVAAEQALLSDPGLAEAISQQAVVAEGGLVVKCDGDNCDWESEDFGHDVDKDEQLYLWHNEPCPCCGVGTIIGDEDLGSYVIFNYLYRKLRVETDPEVIDAAKRDGQICEAEIHSTRGDVKLRIK